MWVVHSTVFNHINFFYSLCIQTAVNSKPIIMVLWDSFMTIFAMLASNVAYFVLCHIMDFLGAAYHVGSFRNAKVAARFGLYFMFVQATAMSSAFFDF